VRQRLFPRHGAGDRGGDISEINKTMDAELAAFAARRLEDSYP
jgi:hypothetical protein